jgi:hypothetical protein
MGNNEVEAVIGVPTNGDRRVLDNESPIGYCNLDVAHLVLDDVDRVNDRLGEGQVIRGGWCNDRDLERILNRRRRRRGRVTVIGSRSVFSRITAGDQHHRQHYE